MNPEDAAKMIEMCLNYVTTDAELFRLQNLVIVKRIDLALPKKRSYTKKEKQ